MYDFTVEAGKIREFARATGAAEPINDAPGAPVPPTFLATAGLLWEPEDEVGIRTLGFDLAGLLHGEEEYRFHGPPPRVGDRLTVTSRIGDTYEKPAKRGGVMRFATVIHEFRDINDRLVAEQITTVIETAAP